MTDVKVVAPMNMGDTLKFEGTQYNVRTDESQGTTITSGNAVGVAVSSDNGNLLQMRSTGLYYGVTPEESKQYLYVAHNGSDSNDGSRNAPFKTVGKALRTVAEAKQQGKYYIHLKAGETFGLADDYIYLGDGTYSIEFRYFDDPYFGDLLPHYGWYPTASTELSRPTLVLDTYVKNGVVEHSGFAAGVQDELVFCGVNLTINSSAGSTTSGGWFLYWSKFDFQGSDINLNGVSQGVGSATRTLMRQCNVYFNGTSKLFISDYSPQIFGQTLATVGEAKTDPTGSLVATGRAFNLYDVLTPDNICDLATFDATTKTSFGWSTNWDIFK